MRSSLCAIPALIFFFLAYELPKLRDSSFLAPKLYKMKSHKSHGKTNNLCDYKNSEPLEACEVITRLAEQTDNSHHPEQQDKVVPYIKYYLFHLLTEK